MYAHERSLVKDYADAPFVLIGVNSDSDLESVRAAVERKNLTWRNFWDGERGTFGPISTAWGVRGWPTLYLIDHEGVIRSKGGRLDEELLEVLVRQARAAGK